MTETAELREKAFKIVSDIHYAGSVVWLEDAEAAVEEARRQTADECHLVYALEGLDEFLSKRPNATLRVLREHIARLEARQRTAPSSSRLSEPAPRPWNRNSLRVDGSVPTLATRLEIKRDGGEVVRLEDAEAAIEAAERRGAEREREACAQVVDRIVGPDDQFAAGFLAEAIRARSRTEGEHR